MSTCGSINLDKHIADLMISIIEKLLKLQCFIQYTTCARSCCPQHLVVHRMQTQQRWNREEPQLSDHWGGLGLSKALAFNGCQSDPELYTYNFNFSFSDHIIFRIILFSHFQMKLYLYSWMARCILPRFRGKYAGLTVLNIFKKNFCWHVEPIS